MTYANTKETYCDGIINVYNGSYLVSYRILTLRFIADAEGDMTKRQATLSNPYARSC